MIGSRIFECPRQHSCTYVLCDEIRDKIARTDTEMGKCISVELRVAVTCGFWLQMLIIALSAICLGCHKLQCAFSVEKYVVLL